MSSSSLQLPPKTLALPSPDEDLASSSSPGPVPAGSVEACHVDYPLQLINTCQWLLLSGWFCPAWESLHLWQAWDIDRDLRVGVQTPLSQPEAVFVLWKRHDHRRIVVAVGITSLLDGETPTLLILLVWWVICSLSPMVLETGKQDAASPRWASVLFSVKWENDGSHLAELRGR